MKRNKIQNVFSPQKTIPLIFNDASRAKDRVFSLPLLTISFSKDNFWCFVTGFSLEGKATDKTFPTPKTVTEFIFKIIEKFPSAASIVNKKTKIL